MEDFRKLTEELWRIYFSDMPRDGDRLLADLVDPGCVVIGTGRHEVYKSAEAFRAALLPEMRERDRVPFQFRDLWCEPVMLGEDVCLVYGGLRIRRAGGDGKAQVNMDSRFSIVYRRRQGRWKLVHIHHSLPNIEQADGEYYPETLLAQYAVKTEEVEQLQTLAERDGLTDLINFRTFQQRYRDYIRENHFCWLLVVDVDKFKCVNDTYGHMAGNRVLQKMAAVLRRTVRSTDMVCRMGGDEFVLLCGGLKTEAQAQAFVGRLRQAIADAGRGEPAWADVSVGKARAADFSSLEAAFGAADAGLYKDKKGPRP